MLADAHPLTYKGGSEIYTENQQFMRENVFLHSFSASRSLGFKHLHMDNKDFYFIQSNHLVKRWNNEDSQANFYLLASLGINPPRSPAVALGTAFDWESRRYYASAKYSLINQYELSRTRIGFAPYLAAFNHVNTWIMLEYNHFVDKRSFNDLTPLVRLYYKNYLVELGYSVNSNYLFNFMIHF